MMLCEVTDKPFERENWIAQTKYDGSRCFVFFDDNGLTLINRDKKNITNRYPELQKIKFMDNVWLDSELVYVEDGKTNFNILQARNQTQDSFKIEILKDLYPTKLIIFDILKLNDKDLRNKPLEERLRILIKFFIESISQGKEFIEIANTSYKPLELWKEVRENEGEGIVLKNLNSRYVNRRSDNWLKCKNFKETFVTFDDYETNRNETITLKTHDNKIRCLCASQIKEVLEQFERFGKAKCEVRYLEKTCYGKLRHPSFRKVMDLTDEQDTKADLIRKYDR